MSETYLWSQFAGSQDDTPASPQSAATRSLLWQLFRNCPIGLMVVENATGKFIAANSEFCRITGYQQNEVLGMPYEQLVAPEDKERIRDYHDRRKRSDPTLPNTYEMLIQNRYGDRRVVVFTAQIIPFRDVIFGSIRDITQEKLLVDPLLYTQKIDSIATLAGGMAHEFNNLLAGISGYAQLAASRAEKMPEVVHAVQSIQAAVESGTGHVKALLAFARRGTHSIQSVDIGQLLRGLLELLPRMAECDVDLSFQLPQVAFHSRGDQAQLEQAFLNIFQNALDALPGEGGKLSVGLDSASIQSMHEMPPGEYMRVTIKDSGQGIPVENIPRVFQPFFSTKSDGKHPGLGLSTSYGTFKEHGGALSVDSNPGAGTTVTAYLPMERNPSLLVPARVQPPQPQESEPRQILIIDDQEFVAELMKDVLETAGYDATFETSGRIALAKLEAGVYKPSLVIVDLLMPDIDGRKVIRQITRKAQSPPVVATSGFTSPEEGDAQLGQMIQGFLKKPFRNDDLLDMIARIIGPGKSPQSGEQ